MDACREQTDRPTATISEAATHLVSLLMRVGQSSRPKAIVAPSDHLLLSHGEGTKGERREPRPRTKNFAPRGSFTARRSTKK